MRKLKHQEGDTRRKATLGNTKFAAKKNETRHYEDLWHWNKLTFKLGSFNWQNNTPHFCVSV